MKLIADSGSTKTHWVVLNNQQIISEYHTQGINPYYQSTEGILNILQTELLPKLTAPVANTIVEVFFYGAGCSSPASCATVEAALTPTFINAAITVNHDLLAAARAGCGNQPGIAVILGTGSNSCLYNGSTIIANQPSLGFILGDEGSGAFLGKRLLQQFLYNELPTDLQKAFSNLYPITKENVLEQVYQKPMPNRYAASFAPFIAQHIEHSHLQKLVTDTFHEFFTHHIASYNQYKQYQLAAIGSIAFVFAEQLQTVASQFEIAIHQIIKEPITGLIQFHNA